MPTARRGNAMRIAGVDAELLDADAVREMLPFLNFDNARFPVKGGLLQRRGGTARHDAVAWGYARGADSAGVDIMQNCEVTGIRVENGRVLGVETTRGFIGAKQASASRWPAIHLPRRRDGRAAPADREPCPAGLRVGRP
jgi:glycine/D-amino acid oxidase-like deaminating enzyme